MWIVLHPKSCTVSTVVLEHWVPWGLVALIYNWHMTASNLAWKHRQLLCHTHPLTSSELPISNIWLTASVPSVCCVLLLNPLQLCQWEPVLTGRRISTSTGSTAHVTCTREAGIQRLVRSRLLSPSMDLAKTSPPLHSVNSWMQNTHWPPWDASVLLCCWYIKQAGSNSQPTSASYAWNCYV